MAILTAVGWVLALAFTWITLSSSDRVLRHLAHKRRLWNAPGWPFMPLAYGSMAIAAYTALGVFPVLPGALLAAAPAVALAVVLGMDLVHADHPLQAATGLLWNLTLRLPRSGVALIKSDIRALVAWVRSRQGGEDVPLPAPAPAPPAGRTVPDAVSAPSIRDDPGLGDAPSPREVSDSLVIEGVPVPAYWLPLIEATGSFEADTDEDLIQHVAGEAAGLLAYADAVRNRGETLLHGTGLDPAYVAGHFEFADEVADLASASALVSRRFHQIYGAIRDWIAGGGILPHNARGWFAPDGGAHDEDEAA